jgi:DNA-directed RNA polymerase subunit RPC12/RpoP
MNPFSGYIDCLNCGNELIHTSKLSLEQIHEIRCDYCGQSYPALLQKVRKRKRLMQTIFVVIALCIAALTYKNSSLITLIFVLLPVYLVYLYALTWSIKRLFKF